MYERDILILYSKITTFKFEDRESTYNVVTFAFRDNKADKDLIGLNKILRCSLIPNSFDSTKAIKPNEYVKATLDLKDAGNNTFKMVITKINGVEV